MCAKLPTVLIICLAGIYAQHVRGECPRCTDPYNPASCTGRQNCLGHSCELRVHRADRNRIEYACAVVHKCFSHGAHECRINQDLCSYCCDNYDACLQKLLDLFPGISYSTTSMPDLLTHSASIDFSTSSVPSEALTTSSVTSATPTTSEALTTSSVTSATPTTSEALTTSSVTSATPTTSEALTTSSVTSATPTTSEALTTSSVTSATPTTSEALTTSSVTSATPTTSEALLTTSVSFDFSTTATPVTGPTPQSCVQCGDFAFDKPCKPIELLFNDASSCPEGLPYCFETVSIKGGNLQVVRGCAEANFCRVEWDIGNSRPGCYPLDVTIANVTCTYCCSGDSCNNITPPSADSIVSFP